VVAGFGMHQQKKKKSNVLYYQFARAAQILLVPNVSGSVSLATFCALTMQKRAATNKGPDVVFFLD